MSIERFLNLFERGVVALEAMVGNWPTAVATPATPAVDTSAADAKAAKAASEKRERDEAAKTEKEWAAKIKADEEEARAKIKADEEEASAFTIDTVRTALREYRTIEGTAAMLEVLKTHGGGATELPGLNAKFYPAIMRAINAVA